jgi:tetratricopeptide (TPR) repeat protein
VTVRTAGSPSPRHQTAAARLTPLARFRWIVLGASVITAAWLSAPSASGARPAQQGLTGAPELAQAYTAILDGRFEAVPPLLARTCGPAPDEACQLLESVNLWWQIQIDPFNRTRDAAFESHIDDAIAAIESWTQREPLRAEAWFYLGGAYGARSQWRVLRGSRLAAARDGKRIKDALERALALDPGLTDAHFGIGLYRYYADVAPAAVKMLQWLFLLPGGDRFGGLDAIDKARKGGLLLRSEADYQLHLIYLWYEKQPDSALELLEGLVERHPRNPHFQQAVAELHDVYRSDAEASLKTWQSLLDAARADRVAAPEMAETAAQLGIARQLDRLSRSEEALEPLRTVINARPTAPFAAVARAHLQLGDVLEHLGRRREATTSYQRAITSAGSDDPLRIASRARAALRAQR